MITTDINQYERLVAGHLDLGASAVYLWGAPENRRDLEMYGPNSDDHCCYHDNLFCDR